LLNKFFLVLSVLCLFSCKRFSDIAKNYVCPLNVLIVKRNFIKEQKKFMIDCILIRVQYCGCVEAREIDVL